MIKLDDVVWIPAKVKAEHRGRHGQSIYQVDALMGFPEDRMIPASPALPAVARWLAETENAVNILGMIAAVALVRMESSYDESFVLGARLLGEALEGTT